MRKMRFKYLAKKNMMPFYKATISCTSGPFQIKITEESVLHVLFCQSVEKINEDIHSDSHKDNLYMEEIEKGSIAFIEDKCLYIHLGNLLNIVIEHIIKRFDSICKIDSRLLELEIRKLSLFFTYTGGYEMFKFADLFLPININLRVHPDSILSSFKKEINENIILRWLGEYDSYLEKFLKHNGAITLSHLDSKIPEINYTLLDSHVLLINDGGNYGTPGAHHIDSLTLVSMNDYPYVPTEIINLNVAGYGMYTCLRTILTMYHILEFENIANEIKYKKKGKKLEFMQLRGYKY